MKSGAFDLVEMIDYKNSNNKGFRYMFIIIDKFSRYLWAIPVENNFSQTITNEFANILTTSKRKPIKIQSDRGAEFYNSKFRKFLKTEKVHHYSRFTGKVPQLLKESLELYVVY